MTSNMLSGERRWASARRSGMTVLGKVAVPKPINLPSQRLENHGLDPNVEIVPKGTLSWGSKSSSSSHAWGSSTPFPNADGGGGSPSHLCARPSSGGSGTRPSTAGSDRAQEPANAWGSNSRPSSASGAITSNQTSFASLRPRSAETRPGSSHLSRFAESVSESSGAWSAAGTAEKLGISSSKNEGFSLTSGDFPTLGSEKDTTRKNTEEDHGSHGRPGSSSGEVAAMKERIDTPVVGDVSVSENVRGGTSSSWRRDNPPCPEDGVHPSVEKWHADPQGPHPFPNVGIHPQHYDAWHGPPINNHPGPGGVWYRGPTGGQPYGSPVPSGPGCFPLEPFPYYRPQIPGTALANPQPVPPLGAGPRGHHPKNGDMYRPPMPDAYVRPAMPIRPGFYPPPVAYEGYYGPPMGYCNPSNPSERDLQFMGMAAGPAPYNMFRGPNAPNISNAHARGSGYGHSGKALGSEHVESGHSHDTRRPYKVLLKQHDALDGKDERKWEDNIPTSVEKDCQQKASSWENDWKAEHRDEEMNLRGTVSEEAPPHSVDQCSGGSVSMKVKSPETTENAKTYINISAKGMEHPASSPEVSAASKDSSLIKKIEGLNAKARASDGQYDATYVSNKEEQKSKSHVNVKPIHSLNEGVTGSGAVYPDRMHGPAVSNSASNEIGTSVVDRSLDSTAASGAVIPRRSSHGVHGRTDHRDRGRFNSQEIDGWQKKSTAGLENSKFNVQDHSSGAAEKSGYPKARDEGEPVQTIHDPRDSQAGRAMMMELAKQRAKQRQKEEEERERDQKAKALAKLEELNKRTQAVESSAQRLGADSCSAIQNKQEGSAPSSKFETSSLAVVSNPNVILDVDESITQVEKSTVLSNELPPESTKAANGETTEEHAQSLTLLQGANAADAPCNNAPEVTNSSAPKQKRVSSRLKHNVPLQKSSTEISVSANTIEAQKGQPDTAVDVASSTEVVANEIASNTILNSAQNIMTESSMQQRRKSGRNSRTKHKVEEASSMAALPSGMSVETNIANNSVEGKAKSSDSDLIFNSVQSLSESKEANQSSERKSSSPNEEFHGKVNNQWKTQHSRRAARNPQSHWAPVRSHNRSEATEEVNQKMDVDAGSSPAKSDPQSQNNPKNKRAEIERYVPKPAAKETAQQGSSQQQVAPLDNQTRVDETVRRTDSGQGAATTTELRSGDGRQYRQGKGHGSWRQRASAESSMHNMQDGQPSNPNNNTHKSTLYQQNQKIDAGLLKEQSNHDEWNSDDGWNIPDPPDSAIPPSVPVTRDQGVAAQGKRHVTKGHRGIGKSHESDHKKLTVGEAEHNTLSPLTDTSQTDFPATSKENRGGDRTLSWQPKSSTSNQRGNRPDGGQNVGAENGKGNKKDSNSRGRVHPPPHQPQKQTSEGMAQPQPFSDLSVPEKGNVEGTVEMGHQDTKGERRTGSAKGRPCSPNRGAGILMEPPPSNVETQLEQRTLGLHRNGNLNNRFCREQESHGDWSSSGQEHILPAKRDRLRHNSHYAYQPVGPQNNNRANNPEGPKDGSHNTGGRFRERGHGHSRHGGGNFHGRKIGNNRVDGGYD